MTEKFADVDAYLASVPETPRATLTAVRAAIRDAVPAAVESISYNQPAYKYNGKPLVYFAAAKHHCSLYGLPVRDFVGELAEFKAFKGTIQFPQDVPFPADLLARMLRARVAAIDAK